MEYFCYVQHAFTKNMCSEFWLHFLKILIISRTVIASLPRLMFLLLCCISN